MLLKSKVLYALVIYGDTSKYSGKNIPKTKYPRKNIPKQNITRKY